jgi:hypothetical protein
MSLPPFVFVSLKRTQGLSNGSSPLPARGEIARVDDGVRRYSVKYPDLFGVAGANAEREFRPTSLT